MSAGRDSCTLTSMTGPTLSTTPAPSRRDFLSTAAVLPALAAATGIPVNGRTRRPNLIFILTDDQRFDALGCMGNPNIRTPNMDRLASTGALFRNAFVTTSICSPSRACCLTGRYGSLNGVRDFSGPGLGAGETTFVDVLKQRGYHAGYAGKWHLKRPADPAEAGFDESTCFRGNGPHTDRKVMEEGVEKVAPGFIEDYLADWASQFIESASRRSDPFLLHYSTQVPHMDHEFQWNPRLETYDSYLPVRMRVPQSWRDDLSGKPAYLKDSRFIQQATKYGYHNSSRVAAHIREYYAAITDMDAALGRMLSSLDRLGLRENTYIVFMGDNGWFLGEHRFTSKMLPYEESIRVPMMVCGPGIKPQVRDEMTLNADVFPTLLDMAGIGLPGDINGRSVMPLVEGETTSWRRHVCYEATGTALGSHPLAAVRGFEWKYIQTYDRDDPSRVVFEELYDMDLDRAELNNLAGKQELALTQAALKRELERLRDEIAAERVV